MSVAGPGGKMPLQEYAEVDRIANRLLAELDPKTMKPFFRY
jgi:hypothetical protein